MSLPAMTKRLKLIKDLEDVLEATPKKDDLFIIKDWNVKIGSQDIPGVTGKFHTPWEEK